MRPSAWIISRTGAVTARSIQASRMPLRSGRARIATKYWVTFIAQSYRVLLSEGAPSGGGRARPAQRTDLWPLPAAQVCIMEHYVKAEPKTRGPRASAHNPGLCACGPSQDRAQRVPQQPARSGREPAELARSRSERLTRSRRAAHATPPGPRAPARRTLCAGRGRAGDLIKRAAHTALSVWVSARALLLVSSLL